MSTLFLLSSSLTVAFLSPFASRAQRFRVPFSFAKQATAALLPGLLRLKALHNAPVERSSSPGNRGFASRPQIRAKLEGRSWWRLPSGLWHASIFPENRPGQSEVRANTRAKEGVPASLAAGGASGSELIASGRASSGFAGRACVAANERGNGGRGRRRGNAVSHNAPAFPRLEDSPLEKQV